ncbi:hypothetical protein Hamer_G020960 [Homarus americanus]|uniref:PDZ domain-containing protein n=1 Tax=Homarus americanus TaxID=6706 RepID=A0A8J5JU92_HOMAM|nr:hypothetical protein Hamer_G020960 [Homarus americanus]
MAKWQGVNVATITEEDVIVEEIGEDGMVETIAKELDSVSLKEDSDAASTGSGNSGQAGGTTSRPTSFERPSSMVENDDVDIVNNNSILSTIIFDSKSNTFPRASSGPKTPPASIGRPSSPSSTPPARKSITRSGSRASGFTMSLSDKFVTEMSLFDPSSASTPRTSISFGIFLATDQVMGDHSVYKVSPVSPLSALKLKPQDRLLKINDMSLAGWSHNCVLDFVRNLPLTCVSGQEYRRSGKNVRSSDEAPVNKRLNTNIRVRKKRATVTSVQEEDVRVLYSKSTTNKLRLNQELPLFLTASDSSSSNTIRMTVGVQEGSEAEVCFRVHSFEEATPRPEGGKLVVIQAPKGNQYLSALNPTDLTFMHGVASDVKNLSQADVRFFILNSDRGSDFVRLKSIFTGRFVSATPDGVKFVSQDEDAHLPDSTLFQIFSCKQ